MSSDSHFKSRPRDFALDLVSEGIVDPDTMVQMCLNWMTNDEVREMLDKNELSPRFLNSEDQD